MALPASGALTLTQIKAAIPSSSNSFAQMSLDAGFTAPHSMSEFYGYSGGGGVTAPIIFYTLK
jgi:hypothetical protein